MLCVCACAWRAPAAHALQRLPHSNTNAVAAAAAPVLAGERGDALVCGDVHARQRGKESSIAQRVLQRGAQAHGALAAAAQRRQQAADRVQAAAQREPDDGAAHGAREQPLQHALQLRVLLRLGTAGGLQRDGCGAPAAAAAAAAVVVVVAKRRAPAAEPERLARWQHVL
jgi:hypothetical protein